jgi:tyrosyl-tRNA synthetase
MEASDRKITKFDPEILQQAEELAANAEILPTATDLKIRLQVAKDQKRPLRVKLGIDPTSTDLHVGHAVVLRKLRQFQDYGHQVVIIIGGFTAQIGDPSGRDTTRPPLTDEDVQKNAKTYLDQMGLVLDLKKAEITNNADWLKPLSLDQIIKLASLVTVNQLLAKEAFGERLSKQLPISLHELFYPILQGYDSVAIKADIEFGGTDQRFNILQGRELQPLYGLEPQLAMLMPLLEGTDGDRKMSKTFGNYIALKDPPADMFGKCMRIPDNLIVKYFQLASTLSSKETETIAEELKSGKNPKDLKLRLAEQIVSQYHGKLAAELELENWDKVHSKKQLPESNDIKKHKVQSNTPLFRILVESGLSSGTAEAKRLISEGAVRYHGEPVKDPNSTLDLTEEENVLQIGRRKFVSLVKADK